MRVSVQLAPVTASVASARQWAETTLRSAGLTASPTLDDLKVVVSELVGNAVRHAGTPIEVTLEIAGDEIRLEVADSDPSPVVPPGAGDARGLAGPWADRGRGLLLVDRLADRWGVDVTPTGKRVWARWPAGPAAG